jgi:pimeloyl-ACP methyl ester carboxylesterase
VSGDTRAQMDETFQTIQVGGHATRLLDIGAGPPIVVLHGWGGRIESMGPVYRCLADRARVICIDLPGFGDSPAPSGTWGTADYSAYVRDLLVDLGIATAGFVGHSFGAKTALYLAATHPSSVDKLVVVGSSGIRAAPTLKARVRRTASRVARATGRLGAPGRAVRDRAYRRLASQDYRDAGPLRPTFVKVVNEDLSSLLPLVKSPTLLVWGSNDDAVPIVHARKMESLIPDAGLVIFEGAGHFAYLDEPDRFCRVVRHFFSDG